MLRRIARSSAFRWALTIASGFAVMAGSLSAMIYWRTSIEQQHRLDHRLVREAQAIARWPGAEISGLSAKWLSQDGPNSRAAALFAPDGSYLSGNVPRLPAGVIADGTPRDIALGIDLDQDGESNDVARTVSLRLGDGRVLLLAYDPSELEEFNRNLLHSLEFSLAPMIVLALASGLLLALQSERRIAEMHRAIDRIVQGDLGERLVVSGTHGELDKLAGAVNTMLAKIESLVGQLRGVGDSMAHDLRTPLTRVRMRLERGRDEAKTRDAFLLASDQAIMHVDQALAVVTAVLRIGEIAHGRRRAAFSVVDLGAVMRDAAELYEPFADEKSVTLKLRHPDKAMVWGDHHLLLEALGNLIDNAIKYTPKGSVVRLSLDIVGNAIRLSVADQGPGIPIAERARVLERFYRVEASRSVAGCGLGLSLASAIVALHGFTLEIADAGPGCVVSIACPAMAEAETLCG
jgi:signal transduction histidine kinase